VDDNRKATAQVLTDSETWMWRIVIAIILGEAIWGFVVSITTDLILPLVARTIGRGQSVTFTEKGDFNGLGIFASFVELCLAAMIAILLKSGVTKLANSWTKPASEEKSTPVRAPTGDRNAASTTVALAAAVAAPVNAAVKKVNSVCPPPSPPPSLSPSPSPKPPKPEKTKSPKKVYYNIVGEPIDSDED